MSIQSDLEETYAAAQERLEQIREAWFAEGQMFTGVGSQGQIVEDALLKVLRDHERHVAALAKQVEPHSVGRPQSPDRRAALGAPPVMRLADKRKPKDAG